MKRELINSRVNRVVPEVTPISLSHAWNLDKSDDGRLVPWKFVGISRVIK
jgi:hypothetical protein